MVVCMGIKLVLLVVALLIITPLVVVGVDLGLTATSVDADSVDVATSDVTSVLSNNNQTLDVSVDVTIETPPAGFLPKSILINLQLYDSGGNKVGAVVSAEFDLGSAVTKTITHSVELDAALVQSLSSGDSLTFEVRGTAGVALVGISLPVEFDVPTKTFQVN